MKDRSPGKKKWKKKKNSGIFSLNAILLYLCFGAGRKKNEKMLSLTSVSATRVPKTQGQSTNPLQLSNWTELLLNASLT